MKNTLKKILVIAVLAIMLVGTLCACNHNAIYKKLNGMCEADYTKIKISVTTEMGGDKLTSLYTVGVYSNMTCVDYSIQEFATFDMAMDEDIIIAPEERIKTSTGSIEIKGTSVEQVSGEPIDIDESKLQDITKVNLRFGALYFENATYTNTTFEADVKDPSAFMKAQSLNCTNMKVKVTYLSKFESIIITYTADGATHTIAYSFD